MRNISDRKNAVSISDRKDAVSISDRKEIINFLLTKGTKAAIQMGFDGPYVFVNKADLIRELKIIDYDYFPDLVNYDGDKESAYIIGNMLHLPIGIS